MDRHSSIMIRVCSVVIVFLIMVKIFFALNAILLFCVLDLYNIHKTYALYILSAGFHTRISLFT